MPGMWSASSCGAQRSLVLLMGKTLGFGVLETQGLVYHHRMKQAASLVKKGCEQRVSWISFKDLLTHLHREGWDFPGGVSGKRAHLPMHIDRRDVGSIPGSGRSPRVGNGNPLWYSCLENPMDRGTWWAAVLRDAKRRT